MFAHTFRRLLSTIPTLLVVIGVIYILLFSAPGGPFDSERVVPEAIQAQLMSKYHLDQPYWKQYLLYIWQLLQGDLGVSYRYADWSVNELWAVPCQCHWLSAAWPLRCLWSLACCWGRWRRCTATPLWTIS